ncbi:unnamed protein product [Adineta steineri]|uniref:G-protein coupled receptors family 1 profile domain-containing protein n=1 Tax=Adineta steineri TaxID=433720 RepID=A0A815L561_9BILA|nr:unnamed protein product [Adineta steineri]CAF3699605.1 unnamed protein product [Adineta steineri]
MNNSSLPEDLTWAQNEIDDLWRNINNAPSDPVSYWVSIASFIFAILGLISNLMSVIVLSRLSTQLSTFVYLTGLSLSDMITCISIIITNILEYFVQNRRNTSITILLRYIEIIFGAVAAGSRTLSLWISTGVTMDRWVLICYPIYAKTFCTLNRAKNVLRTLLLIALFYSIPLIFEYEIIRMPMVYQKSEYDNDSLLLSSDENFDKNNILVTKGYSDLAKRRLYRWAYFFFNAIFVYTIPTITIVFFNLQLIRALHQLKSRAKRLGKTRPAANGHDQSRTTYQTKYSVTIMVCTIVLTLLICRSPTIVLWILWSFDLTIKIFFSSPSSSLNVRHFHNIANLIAIINAATNFLPFCVFGQLFRTECLNIYCCRKSKRKFKENNQRKKKEIVIQQPLTITNEHLPNVLLLNSDSIIPEQQKHSRSSSITKSLINGNNNNGEFQNV